MPKRLTIFLFLLFIACGVFKASANLPEIQRLDEMIAKKTTFDKAKYARIDSLKTILNRSGSDNSVRLVCLEKLGDEFMLFKADSAIYYYTQAVVVADSLGDPGKSLQLKLKQLRPEMIVGFYSEVSSEYNSIDFNQLPDSLHSAYYECGYRIYSFALNSINRGSIYYNHYYNTTDQMRKKWIASLPEESMTRRLYEAEQALWDKKNVSAKLVLGDLLSELPETSNEYAIAAGLLATILNAEGKKEGSMKFYALSAISDLQCSVKENQSMYELSMLLYDKGDIERAYRYIFSSIEDAAFCNAQVRVYNASRMLPVIEGAHRAEVKSHENMLEAYIVIVSLLLIGLLITVFFLVKQMRKLSTARKKLHDANMAKDEYMGQFLELSSVYMKRLDSFTKLVNRKLVSGQVEDLLKMTKSARFSEEQHRGFYREFDNAFLKIYTTFVEDVNALLRPEERIIVPEPGMLTAELRIYALHRMGLEDNMKIAEFLKYSVNTVYAYRNKMRNKAIDRENFEKQIMQIGVID